MATTTKTLTAIGDWVILDPIKPLEKSSGGILLVAPEDEQIAIVVSVNPKVTADWPELVEGARVAYARVHAQRFMIDDDKYEAIIKTQIFAVLD